MPRITVSEEVLQALINAKKEWEECHEEEELQGRNGKSGEYMIRCALLLIEAYKEGERDALEDASWHREHCFNCCQCEVCADMRQEHKEWEWENSKEDW